MRGGACSTRPSSKTYINEPVRRELSLLLERGEKAELEAAISRDPSHFFNQYLPNRLFDSDLVKL
jgi:DNA topoisomerase VI subunit A